MPLFYQGVLIGLFVGACVGIAVIGLIHSWTYSNHLGDDE